MNALEDHGPSGTVVNLLDRLAALEREALDHSEWVQELSDDVFGGMRAGKDRQRRENSQ